MGSSCQRSSLHFWLKKGSGGLHAQPKLLAYCIALCRMIGFFSKCMSIVQTGGTFGINIPSHPSLSSGSAVVGSGFLCKYKNYHENERTFDKRLSFVQSNLFLIIMVLNERSI